MKRDMDLIRDILLAIESSNEDPRGWINIEIESHTKQEISYHLEMLDEVGLVDALDASTMGPDGYEWKAKRLTYRGHEFLDAIREQEVWRETKEAAQQGGTEALEFIWEIAKAVIKKKLKEHADLDIE